MAGLAHLQRSLGGWGYVMILLALVSRVNFPSIYKTISHFQFSSEIEKHCSATLKHLEAVDTALLAETERDWRVRACRGPWERSRALRVGG